MRFKDLQAKISIHALRVEGDHVAPETGRRIEIFLSTPSGWRATYNSGYAFAARRYFYPRPPGGGRQNFRSCPTCRILFLSTPSGWRATESQLDVTDLEIFISIHALRVEGDPPLPDEDSENEHFYPRPPGGGRRLQTLRARPH